MKQLYIFLFFVLFAYAGKAQYLPPNQPEQNPCTPIVIACGQPFSTPSSYRGVGSGPSYLWNTCATYVTDIVWVSVQAQTSGVLLFTITPGNPGTDYDFVVFDMNTTTCSGLSNATAIRCNAVDIYSSPGGLTGLNNTSTLTSQGAGTGNPWLQRINATAGTTYLIGVIMAGGSYAVPVISGFTIDFTGSTIFLPSNGVVSVAPQGPIRVCQGTSVNLTASYSISGPVTYQWSLDGTDITGATNATYTATSAGSYSVRAVGACGANSATTQIDYIVHPAPEIGLSGPSTFCEGQYVTLTASAPGATSLQWQKDGANIPGAGNYTYTTAATGNYTVTAMIEGCAFVSAPQTITVRNVDASFTASRMQVCKDEPVSFTNSSTGVNLSYLWRMGDNTTETTTSVQHAYAQAGNYEVTLVATDDIGCKDSMKKQIEVPLFELKIDPDVLAICPYKSVQLTSDITAPSYFSSYQYSWSPAAGLSDAGVQQPVFHNDPGDYSYELTVTSQPLGCVVKDKVDIHVYPRTSLYNITPDTKIAYGSSIQLNADGGMYYSWFPPVSLDNPNISHPVASPVQPTTYTLYAINDYGCFDTAYVRVDIDYTMHDGVPNAFTPNGDGKNDVFKVVNVTYQKLEEFRIYNRWGNEVFSTNDAGRGWDGSFNGVQQPMGSYFYIIKLSMPDGTNKTLKGEVLLIR